MSKVYGLEERTFNFARNVNLYCKRLKLNHTNKSYIDQVIRSSGSIGANYIEANESLSKKDFLYRIRICRKESKETAYWLKLLYETDTKDESLLMLYDEAVELKKILSAIVEKSK